MFSLESPHRGDSNEYTQYTIFNIKMKTHLNYTKSAIMGFFLGTKELDRNSRGKRAMGVRAIEVVLYYLFFQIRSHRQSWNIGMISEIHCYNDFKNI